MVRSGRLLCLALALAAVGARTAAADCTPGSVVLALTAATSPAAAYPTCFARFDVAVNDACAVTVTPAAAANTWTYSALWTPVEVQDTNQQVGGRLGRLREVVTHRWLVGWLAWGGCSTALEAGCGLPCSCHMTAPHLCSFPSCPALPLQGCPTGALAGGTITDLSAEQLSGAIKAALGKALFAGFDAVQGVNVAADSVTITVRTGTDNQLTYSAVEVSGTLGCGIWLSAPPAHALFGCSPNDHPFWRSFQTLLPLPPPPCRAPLARHSPPASAPAPTAPAPTTTAAPPAATLRPLALTRSALCVSSLGWA